MRDVADAMRRVDSGSVTQNDIAREWGVTPGRVSQIFKREREGVRTPAHTTLALFATPAPKVEYDEVGNVTSSA